MDKPDQEILLYSYWEHFKYEKELSYILPLTHPKRVNLRRHINELQKQLKIVDDNNGDNKY